MNNDEPRCELCRYFKRYELEQKYIDIGEDSAKGWCRAHPQFIWIAANEWCGEFDEQKKEQQL